MARVWKLWTVLLFASVGHGQTSRGAVSGTITDSSGGVITNASLELVNTSTGVRLTTFTNAQGLYRLDAVDLGTYEARATHPGFKKLVASGLKVEANHTLVLDLELELGSAEASVNVSAAAEILERDGPLRGGNLTSVEITKLPLPGPSPLSLGGTIPGVIVPSATLSVAGGGASVQFSVNGQRLSGNNFLLDGTNNNDIEFTGLAQPFNIADAVEEVSVQTSNFSVEFGAASGGIFNVVTKSGTNAPHGTAFWRYQSQRFDSISNLNRLNDTPQSVFAHNIAGFTAGGPIRKDKTFIFAGFQEDSYRSTANFALVVPTESAVATLLTHFPDNPRLTLYLNALGSLRGVGAPFPVTLSPDADNVQFATASVAEPQKTGGPEWLARIDHYLSEKHRISGRYIYDRSLTSPNSVFFPGFIADTGEHNQNVLFSDNYTLRPDFTNEFRFSYGRLDAAQSQISSRSLPEASTLPQIIITGVASPGLPSAQPFRHANNFLFQETQTKLAGRHTFRYGAELLRQLATEAGSGFPRGQITFGNSTGYSSFANFLDDFSGQLGRIRLTIGGTLFHPDQFHQAYFFQDTWKVTRSLTLTMGLRYENFGQPVNAFRFPAFAGFDPNAFFQPNHVNTDNLNFGPSFGLAWSPSEGSSWLRRVFGDRKTVWRGGYQITYDPLYTQILALDLATSSPNAISVDQHPTITTGRGNPGWLEEVSSITPSSASLTDPQYGTLEKNFRNPYTEHYSFGFQRAIGATTLLDVAYVGAQSHKLTTRADLNPLFLTGARLYPNFGDRTVRTSQGNSSYNALQIKLDRRLSRGFQMSGAYTWSKSIDSTSEGIGQANAQYVNANLTSVPVLQGGLKLDRALSDFDRPQRLVILYLWSVPGPARGVWKQIAGGWSITGITTFQSGTPYTILNGGDRNGDGWAADRPDIGNAAAPLSTRAIIWPTMGAQACPSGYRDPDTNLCTSPLAVHWVEGVGMPNSSTVGRNTLRTGGTNNFDISLFKTFSLSETRQLELRWEAQNAFNHPQYIQVPQNDVFNTKAGFLSRDYTDSGIRSMWVQMKLLF